MANTWTTLLDAVYPTGSLYFSTNSTSPASKFGGTWSQIQDAFIAAKGSSYITGTVAAYSGNKAMTVKQMPSHNHNSHNRRYLYDSGWGTHSDDWAVPSFAGSGKEVSTPWWYTQLEGEGGGAKFRSLLLFYVHLETYRLTAFRYLERASYCLNLIAPKGVMNNG